MKKILTLIFLSASAVIIAQPKKAPKMAPVLAEGYYVVAKGDTVKGEVQTNPDDETDLYHKFGFKPKNGGKVMPVDVKKAKAYGYDQRHFEKISYEGEDFYVEVLAKGRLNFFEYRFNGKIDGLPAIEANYFIQDTRAEGADAGLKDLKKISNRFYKKDLQPYMKYQKMIWNDLDKFTFKKDAVTNAIIEYNKFYVIEATPAEKE